jgi:NAD(P)-dependent dehydrogenase (short-subunit alcohol dehydrogenase family)
VTADQPLGGRVAIVTGASSGIGEAVARALAGAGAAMVLAARSAGKLAALAAEIHDAGGTALDLPTDVTREAEVRALFARTIERFGRLDILVNNAGIADHTATEALSLARWREVIDANLTSAFLCSREALAVMRRQGRGRIVNIGSLSAKVPRPDTVAYVASKFGLEGLTRSLALDGRAHGVTASILHPGVVATALASGMAALPAREISSPADVARMLLLMVTLPDEVNVLELLAVPVGTPFLGRG